MNLQAWATILLTKLLVGKAQFPSGPERFPTFQNTRFYQFDHYYPSISKMKYPQFGTSNQQIQPVQYFEDNQVDPTMNRMTAQKQYNPYLSKLEPVVDTNRLTRVNLNQVNLNQNPSNNHYFEYDKPALNKEDIWNDEMIENQPKVNRKGPFIKMPVPYQSFQLPTLNSNHNTQLSINNGISEVEFQPQDIIKSVTISPSLFSANHLAEHHLNNLNPLQIETSENNLPDMTNLKNSKLIINNKENDKTDDQKEFVHSPSLNAEIPQNLIYHKKLKDSSKENELVHRPEVLLEEKYYYQPSNSIKKNSLQPLKEKEIDNVSIVLSTEPSSTKSVENVKNSVQISDANSLNFLFPNTSKKLNELMQPQEDSELSSFQSPQNDKGIDFKTLKHQLNTENLDIINNNYNNSITKENKNQYSELPSPYNNTKDETNNQYPKVSTRNKNKISETEIESETEPSINVKLNRNYSTMKIPVSTQPEFNHSNSDKLKIKQNSMKKLTNQQTTDETIPSTEYTTNSAIINYDTDILSTPFDDSLYYDDDINTTNNVQKNTFLPQQSIFLNNTGNKTILSSHSKNTTNSSHLGNKQLNKTTSKINTNGKLPPVLLSNKTEKVNIKQNRINISMPYQEVDDKIIPFLDSESTTPSRFLGHMTLQPIYLQSTAKNKAMFSLRAIDTTTYYDENYINPANNGSKKPIISQKLQLRSQNQDLINSSLPPREISKNTNLGKSHFPKKNENTSKILEKPFSTKINNFNISNIDNINIKNSINNLISQEQLVNKTIPLGVSKDTVNHTNIEDTKLKQMYLPPTDEINSNIDLNHKHFLPIPNNNTKVDNTDNTIHNTVYRELITTKMSNFPTQIPDKTIPIMYTEDQPLNQPYTKLENNSTLEYKPINNQENEINYYGEHSPAEIEDMWTEVGPEINSLRLVE